MIEKKFLEEYIQDVMESLRKIDYDTVMQILNIFEKTLNTQSKIYVIGNGGSSATASHIVNDLGIGLKRRDIISFDIISLGDNVSVVSAIANDIGYENIFYMQLKDVLKTNDVVVAISCSGNSSNVIKAVDYAKQVGATVIGITGFDGGILRNICDINFHVETSQGEYGLVEDIHMILNHMIYSYYIKKGKKNNVG